MNKAFFILPKGKNFKRGEVLTTPTEKTDIKTPSSVIVAPAPVLRIKQENDNTVSHSNEKKTPIKGLFIGVNKDIPVHSFYIDSDGDLHMFGIFSRTRKIIYDTPVGHPEEFKLIHESFNHCETVCKGDFTISNQQYIKKELVANSGTITFIEPVYVETAETDIEENDSKETLIRSRAVSKSLTGDVIELCEINYGYYRKHKQMFDTLFSYKHDNKITPGEKTIYEGILICKTTDIDMAKDLIKQVLHIDKKVFVNYL